MYFTELLKFQKSSLADAAEVRRLRLVIVELERLVHYRLTKNEVANVSVEDEEKV